jgi:hypothetical protein
MNRSEHDRILNTYVRPEALIATAYSCLPHQAVNLKGIQTREISH